MPAPRLGRVFLVELVPPRQESLFGGPAQHVEEVLWGGNRTVRYGRTWIVGPVERSGSVLSGRIGFLGATSVAELWDEERGDFVEHAVPQGLTAPFAVDLSNLRAALQVRPPLIRINSLIGALEALLSDEGARWKIRGVARQTSLPEWLQSVDKVTAVRMTARIPNPHWSGAKDLQALMESAEAEVVALELRSEEGLELDSPFLAQTQHHIERGYGEARYTGVVDDVSGARETVYSTKFGSEEVSAELAADPGTGEVPLPVMREHLASADNPADTRAKAGDDGGPRNPFHPPA